MKDNFQEFKMVKFIKNLDKSWKRSCFKSSKMSKLRTLVMAVFVNGLFGLVFKAVACTFNKYVHVSITS